MTENLSRARNSEDARCAPPNPQGEHREKRHAESGPLVSVVIPCYNQAHFLGEAIESVLVQSHPNFEIVVVDDGSTDGTSEVAARYPGVRCVRQKNQGLPAATRNRGLRESKGSYVVFLDADDRLLPEALELGLECFDSNPECAFVSGHYREISVDGSPLRTGKQPRLESENYVEILRCNYIITPAVVMHRRSVFDSVGGFNTSSSVKGSEDSDLCLRIAREFPVYCHGNVVAEYRVHGTSLSHNSALMLKATITVRLAQLEHVRGNKQYEEAIEEGVRVSRDYYGGRLVSELRTHVREGEWTQALQGMLVLLRYYPQGLALLNNLNWLEEYLSEQGSKDPELWKLLRDEQLQTHREQFRARTKQLEETHRKQLKKLEGALEEERREVRRLRKRSRRFALEVQNLDQQLQNIRGSGKWRLLRRMAYIKAKLLRK